MVSLSQTVTQALINQYAWGELDVRLASASHFKCEYCGRDFLASVDDYDSWQQDHIIPQSRGGTSDFANLAASCKTCNFIKRTYVPVGDTREQRITDAARYVQAARARKLTDIAAMRSLIYAP